MKTVKNPTIRILMFTSFLAASVACQDDAYINPAEESALRPPANEFDFDQFGKSHNAYLAYVWNIEGNADAETRFRHGLTYTDPVFGSFNIGLKWEDIDRSIAFHKERVDAILDGSYRASSEKLSQAMTSFLDELAASVKAAVDRGDGTDEITTLVENLESQIQQHQDIRIDLRSGISNDGASMMAICAILKYSLAYWTLFEQEATTGGGERRALGNGAIKRALADAWGYVSAWVNNGDGSYSWDHQSALVNADCVSDRVREN